MIYGCLRWVMRTITTGYLRGRFRVVGAERVPSSGPLLVCANHTSTVDPPMVPAFLPRPDSWSMAKSEYFARPGFTRWLFTSYQAFPVVRHTADRRALRRAFEILAGGHVLVVYPEGTRVEAGGLREPEPGAGYIALRSGAPVLPVGLIGTRTCFPKGGRWPRRTPVEVVFGPPFAVAQRRPDGTRVRPQEASQVIMLAIAELLPEAERGEFADFERRWLPLEGLRRPAPGSPGAGDRPEGS